MMTLMKRITVGVGLLLAIVLLASAAYMLNAGGGSAGDERASPQNALGGAVLVTETTAYTTRPLTRGEVVKPILPVALPLNATDIQFAEYHYWIAYELFVSFHAPSETCLAYANAILHDFNTKNPDRRVSGELRPLRNVRPGELWPFEKPGEPRPLGKIISSELPVPWFTPEFIQNGVEGGAAGSHTPIVWVDVDRGIFYYQYTD